MKAPRRIRSRGAPSPCEVTPKDGPVAQLDRASDFYSEGCRFESCRDRHYQIFPVQFQSLGLPLVTAFKTVSHCLFEPWPERRPLSPLATLPVRPARFLECTSSTRRCSHARRVRAVRRHCHRPCRACRARLYAGHVRGNQIFQLDGDNLTIRTAEQVSAVFPGKRVVGTLNWERER
jgi:hypothetical protein